MAETHFDDDDLFQSRKDYKNEYSTFIEELQQSTEKLMNEVFNAQYVPQINEEDLHIPNINKIKKNNQSMFTSVNASRNKTFTNADFNSSKRTNFTKCSTQRELSDSFVNFLTRNQKWKQRRLKRAKHQHNKKQQQELKGFTFTPNILKSSKEKVIEPIYQRCLQIQKEKQKKMALKKIEKEKEENQKQSQYTFHPTITTKAKNRSLEQYLKDKQEWHIKKMEYIENQKLWQDARRNEECIFHPVLINKNNAAKNRDKISQKVQDRLLRSLQSSIQKKQNLKKKI